MRQSQLFCKTKKEAPKDEISINARFLIRAGFIDKLMAGVYTFLPLGWRVMKKIENIIREEINNIGGEELLMPSLQPKELYTQTDIGPENKEGWGRMREVMYELKDKTGRDVGFGSTHEEVAVDIAKKFINSYKDLPVYFYQFQNKFRQEKRAKSGIIRTREFIMKDLYSFHKTAEELDRYYFEEAAKAYKKIFSRAECNSLMVEASGGSFTKHFSHEFQAICEAGEDKIAHCEKCDFAQNIEIYNKTGKTKCPKCGGKIIISKSVEIGNFFRFYDKYAKSMNMYFRDEKGNKQPIHLGSYGIGLGRLMGTVVENNHDEKGIIWPKEIAPFSVHLISLENSPQVKKTAGKLYKELTEADIEVLYDDRDKSTGEKFAEADLIGIPQRLVISERTLKENSVELKQRSENRIKLIKLGQVKNYVENVK
ncbi:MAG: hypothetical protein COX92_01860 [Candidatus Nealsonbacteria bacterium CG_4_10_14_0_2_um_filter_40_15]|uniref:Proline--tRNA ligase n=2 Tax=Candidatus Nealsoniibacteriota TaxID=1817911 RepID=A0A2M7D8G1_9BACT|nr:MAG: hypothetical protein COS26_00695 [Candidatus Nealsonbacteria bacterium CG02_land_8_20_14_3_00_40_11]PIZ87108.1 MAG: hypothetical protein COX92_01860 [Candidatus Nealsonbacteria bacterium CG_4_10_14_0_2_um_filter_40_15]